MALTPDGQKLADVLQKGFDADMEYYRKVASRPGVNFTDEQKAQIEDYIANNETVKAQRLILDELNEQFKDDDK